MSTSRTSSARRMQAGFTLAEVLAAMAFMAIVIPVAVDGLRIASAAGELAVRKSEAVRVGERVLNEIAVTSAGGLTTQNGTVQENGHDYQWTLHSELWPQDSMQLLTIEVTFVARDRTYSTHLSTLINLVTLPQQQ
ncbi:MAG TPA: type II secretion system protein [Verrucomicrobiae bacterium]|nr:type II secretion system protein [Verrucomicrobiae bacterium]